MGLGMRQAQVQILPVPLSDCGAAGLIPNPGTIGASPVNRSGCCEIGEPAHTAPAQGLEHRGGQSLNSFLLVQLSLLPNKT